MRIRVERDGGFTTVGAPAGRAERKGGETRFTSETAVWSVRPRRGAGHTGYDLFAADAEAPLASSTANGPLDLPATIQLADGRLFVVRAEPKDAFSVLDDAGLGPYWRGRRTDGGFEVEATVAGDHVEAADALLVLVAVHLTGS